MTPPFSGLSRITDTLDVTDSVQSLRRRWECGMTTARRRRPVAQWFAGTALLLPACSTFDTAEQPAPVPPRTRLAARPVPVSPNVVPAGQLKSEGEKGVLPKDVVTLPPVPAAATQGKSLPIDFPTALALTSANPLDIQIAGERLRAGARRSRPSEGHVAAEHRRRRRLLPPGRPHSGRGGQRLQHQQVVVPGRSRPDRRVPGQRGSVRTARGPAGRPRAASGCPGSAERHDPLCGRVVLHRAADTRRGCRGH